MSFLFVTIMGLILSNSLASHYRGGTIKWAVSPTDPNKLLLSWRVSWRRSYAPASGFRCERPGQALTGEGYLLCEQCNSKIITSMAFNCTDFSDAGEATEEDWATGVGSYEYSFESNSFDITFRFDMQTYSGSNWIPLHNYGQANFYKMVSSVDLTVRQDTGRPNSSPATTMLPIIRVQSGCASKIRIPTLDADGDVVRCRWSEYSKDECPPYNLYGKSVCGPITPDTSLDENRCEITFLSAGKTPGWYGVAVMIEDFADKESTIPLSKIPLQFLIFVYPMEPPCRKIQISSPLCEVISPNEHFSAKIEAFSESEGVRIESIDTVTPIGMTRSELSQSQDDPSKYYIDLNWTPVNVGEETVCYYASDNNGVSSDPGCFKVVVTDSPELDSRPEPLPMRSHPTPGESVSPTLKEWDIYYSSSVERPLYSKKIYIKSFTGGILAVVDTSEEDQVQFNATEDGGTTILFSTPEIEMPDMQHLLIEVEEGAVVATSFGPCAQDLGSTGAGWLFKTNSSVDAPTEPTVVCDPRQMSVYIPKVYVGNMPARKFMFHDPSCRGSDFNETHFVVQTRYDECGSVLKKKNGLLTVRNTVRDKIRPVSNGAAVSRGKHQFEIVAKCKSEVSYDADITLNPDSVQTSFLVHGIFDVAASMALFADDTYDDRYDGEEDAIDIRMNQRLYVSILANQEGVSLKVEQCKAYAVDNQGNMSDGEFIFLDNGCPNDETLQFENSPAPNEKRFSLNAFTFMYTGIKDYITIRCTVSICEGGEDDECGDQCSTGEVVEDTGDSTRGRRSSPRLTEVYLTV